MCNCSEMILVITILFLIPIISGDKLNSAICKEGRWLHNANGKSSCCEYCHPGTYKVSACNTVNRTKCEICPVNTFMDQANQFESCFRCSICDKRGKNMVLKSACSRRMDTACQCRQGLYHYELGDSCKECSICPSGYQTKKDCMETSDRICERCRLGHTYERNGTCIKCQICSVGYVKLSNCTATADAKCRKVKEIKPKGNTNTGENTTINKNIIITVVVSCSVLLVAVIVCIIIFCRRKYLCNGHPLAVNRPLTVTRSSRNDEICIPMEEEYSSLIRAVAKIPLGDLKYQDRVELASLLDPNGSSNWKNLACGMGKLDLYIQNLERTQQSESPTMILIRDFEASKENPTMQDLLQLCKKIKRKDATSVIQKAINSHTNRPEA